MNASRRIHTPPIVPRLNKPDDIIFQLSTGTRTHARTQRSAHACFVRTKLSVICAPRGGNFAGCAFICVQHFLLSTNEMVPFGELCVRNRWKIDIDIIHRYKFRAFRIHRTMILLFLFVHWLLFLFCSFYSVSFFWKRIAKDCKGLKSVESTMVLLRRGNDDTWDLRMVEIIRGRQNSIMKQSR